MPLTLRQADSEPAPAADAAAVARLLACLTDAQRRRLTEREELMRSALRAVDDGARRGLGKLEALGRFVHARPQPITVDHLRKLIARYERRGLPGLLDERGRPADAGDAGFSPGAWEEFKRLYLSSPAKSLRWCYELVRDQAGRMNWSWPSEPTVRKRVQAELPPAIAEYHRLGPKRWEARRAPRIQRDYSAFRPNQIWVGDHCELDQLCLVRERPVRPWLTAWMDMRSRLIVGWCLSPAPNSDTILQAFARGVRAHGAPLEVIIDNGKDYRSIGLFGGKKFRAGLPDQAVSLCGELGITPHFAIPFNAASKPIERFFGTLHERFDKLSPSYCGNRPEARPEHLYADLRVGEIQPPTLEQLRESFAQWLDVDYHQRPHSGDAMSACSPAALGRSSSRNLTPLEAFALDPIPKRTAPAHVLETLLMKKVNVRITRHGLRVAGLLYGQGHPEVFRRQGQDVLVRYDPEDRGRILVCELDGRTICECFDQRLVGVSSDEVREGQQRKGRARKMARAARTAMRDEQRPLLDHVLEAKAAAAPPLQQTGTDGVPARSVALLPGARNAAPVEPDFIRSFEFAPDDANEDEPPPIMEFLPEKA